MLSDSAGCKGGVFVGVGLGTPDSLLGCVLGAVGFWVAVGVNFSYFNFSSYFLVPTFYSGSCFYSLRPFFYVRICFDFIMGGWVGWY